MTGGAMEGMFGREEYHRFPVGNLEFEDSEGNRLKEGSRYTKPNEASPLSFIGYQVCKRAGHKSEEAVFTDREKRLYLGRKAVALFVKPYLEISSQSQPSCTQQTKHPPHEDYLMSLKNHNKR